MLDPPVESSRRRATLTIALVGLTSAVAAVDFVQQGLRWLQLTRLENTCLGTGVAGCRPVNGTTTADALTALDDRAGTILIVEVVALLAAGIAWLVWQHGAQGLLDDRLRTPDLRITPGWAVGWWFVPFANLGKPAVAMAELWRASGGADASHVHWASRKLPGWFGWWWALWLAQDLVGFLTRTQVNEDGSSLASVRVTASLLTLGAAATVAAGVLAIILVRSVQSRLERAMPYVAARPTGLPPSSPHWSPQPASTLPWATSAGAFPPPPAPVVLPPAPAAQLAPPEPPAWRSPKALAVGLAAVALVGVVAVVLTSPSIELAGATGTGAGATPSVVPSVELPADWHGHGGTSDGFTLAAPGSWKEEPTSGAHSVLQLVDASANLRLVVGSEQLPAGIPLEQYVELSMEHLGDSDVLDVESTHVRPVTLPGGPAELATIHGSIDGVAEAFFQYYLVEARTGWVLTYVTLAGDEATLAPVADQISGTFRLVS